MDDVECGGAAGAETSEIGAVAAPGRERRMTAGRKRDTVLCRCDREALAGLGGSGGNAGRRWTAAGRRAGGQDDVGSAFVRARRRGFGSRSASGCGWSAGSVVEGVVAAFLPALRPRTGFGSGGGSGAATATVSGSTGLSGSTAASGSTGRRWPRPLRRAIAERCSVEAAATIG
jgi:hypothetical protein